MSARRKVLVVTSALALGATVLGGAAAQAVGGPDTERLPVGSTGTDVLQSGPGGKITIDVVTANGTGCPPGSAAVSMSPDNQAMTMTFSEYIAQTGPGIASKEFRKNCQLSLKLNVPQGFSYGIVKADYRGFAKIAKGSVGYQDANYYYQGSSATAKKRSPIVGQYDGDYIYTDETAIADVVWSPCGAPRYLNVNTALRIDNKGNKQAENYMSNDSADVSVATKFNLAWRKC